MNTKLITRAGEIISSRALGNYAEGNSGYYSSLALIDFDGYPTVSTLSISKADGVRTLYYITSLDSNAAKRAKNNNRASVCINADLYHISLVGTIEVLTDLPTKNEMWYSGAEEHFSGPDDPNLCILRFTTERYNILIMENDDYDFEVGKITD